jgi:hypothetical protein
MRNDLTYQYLGCAAVPDCTRLRSRSPFQMRRQITKVVTANARGGYAISWSIVVFLIERRGRRPQSTFTGANTGRPGTVVTAGVVR